MPKYTYDILDPAESSLAKDFTDKANRPCPGNDNHSWILVHVSGPTFFGRCYNCDWMVNYTLPDY